MTGDGGVIAFLRRLIRTESPPGAEGAAAELVADEMGRLGYDEVELDEAGNVIGWIRGRDEAPSVMLNTHLDHVDPGDPADWPHPPFAGELEDGKVWGRGAVDIKGPLAAQVHGAAAALSGGRPPGDVAVTAVVQEEVGGLGARHLLSHLGTDLVVVGEPSSNGLRRGHRGRAELVAEVRGRSAHASAPERGRNPLHVLAAFVLALEELELPADEELGRATVAPTVLGTDQESANVIPSRARLVCDCRLVPGQETETLRERLAELLEENLREGTGGTVAVPGYRRRSYRGLEMEIPADNPAFVLPADHPAVRSAADVLSEALGREVPVGLWGFATDGGHFAGAGLTVVGFGPGREELAHTVEEHVEVEELQEAVRGYRALARRWPRTFLEEVGG